MGTPQHADFDLAALEKLREVNLINFVLLATKIAVFWSNRERAGGSIAQIASTDDA